MPRPKVQESNRRRIAKACLHCQSSKLKCDGKSPCTACARRQQPESCAYSDHVRSYGHRRRRAQKPASNTKPNEADGVIEIAVPKLPKSLYDTRGKVVYLGDCSALSFLQNVQELIEREAQSSNSEIHSREFEELPPDPDDRSLSYTGSVEDLTDLIKTFFTVISGLLDIIDPATVETLLWDWIHGSLGKHRGSEAVLYLIFAYASQARASSTVEKHRAHSFYHHGRHIALLHLTDDPSVETVQAFILISLYMLACSRRNGAFLNLGIAISAAKALGLHRKQMNEGFPVEEARLRERIWATLRYHDLFFCAMMGRTSSTITTDCTVSSTQLPSISDPSTRVPATQETAMLYSAHAFSFMERTVNEIYTKRTVSMGVLKDLAQELREAIKDIPQVYTISPSMAQPTVSETLLRNANILCSYHFTMMLLTRPFVVASLRARLGAQSTASSATPIATTGIPSICQNDEVYDELATNALSCIRAAIETIRILHHLLSTGALYSNMPLTVAWTFVSSLTICSAYFGQLGVPESNEQAIAQAREILAHFALSSPQARRYSGILGTLSDAATGHAQATTRCSSQVRRGDDPAEIRDLSLLDSWDMSNLDMHQFPLDLGNAESIWDLNWIGSLM
ncbi:fungal-specific transcription factor domain-containing protein [Aspergillus keveii]|uniref:Fungal-specific transcription factor domain-containing protein n=1 Tax=Aspergillus keveii TaxID=714993 RepID=A0ABR4G4R7_9EURO